ncbi:PD-(D/E)XK nuclease superfamily protein [Desulfocicer vacuolatum DSM 3385]|uniref:PD-(D/E)XK nuclease superfamily protein n=1 Tax=Desulfocicer vacuolatum DSM 3385 TaxID=1121400 RepID=A0A1W2ASQ9_9BACT|nr:ATP-binding protein [Desulfocicer vacuolatum]SMC63779.1 PD-(D/E)XK nuclease superfamily protein [Desulfocicer vacuolatum DSM 3385]
MKKLPIGVQTFSKLREGGYCYVDKTELIYQLTHRAGDYYFLARPRRFGKSLLVSTLKAAFSGQKTLFKGLYLENNWDWDIKYPVIDISFGRGIVESRAILEQRIKTMLEEHAHAFGIELRNENLADRFAELIQKLEQKYQHRVVILVDEYDKPILDNIDTPDIAMEIREGLKNFYSVIKDRDAHIRFALLTGVSKFSKVSIFSGLNNLNDISLEKRYATLCGYTTDEIKQIFADYLNDVDFKTLGNWYDGYNFMGEHVYNPYNVLLYLDNRTFRNYWFETGSPSFLVKLIQKRQYAAPQLEQVKISERMLSSFDIDHIEIETLLFQTGYLTIKKVTQQGPRRIFQLTYPNLEVKMSLAESLLTGFVRHPLEQEQNLSATYKALQQGDMNALKSVFHAFFASIPHDWYRKNQLAGYEGYYASIFYCYFTALGLAVTAEDTTNKGQIDLAVRLDNNIYVMEFKVIGKTGDAGSALKQIKDKNYHDKFLGTGVVIYIVGVAFNKEDRNIAGFEWEQISH